MCSNGECIVIQIGQCGNQIGSRLWNKILTEHSTYNSGTFTPSLSTFFTHLNNKGILTTSLKSPPSLHTLKARGIIIDMEPNVVNQILKSSIKDLFFDHQMITSNSGSGNNWGCGYYTYGNDYNEVIMDGIRKEAEKCDALSAFFMIHSLGGGTGSGLGSFVNEQLADYYPDVIRFNTCICPSFTDDVVTSPYNTYTF